MTKAELTAKVQLDVGCINKVAKTCVDAVFSELRAALVMGEDITIQNFGIFEVVLRNAKRCRNPQTGEAITIPEMWVVKFRPGKALKEAVKK